MSSSNTDYQPPISPSLSPTSTPIGSSSPKGTNIGTHKGINDIVEPLNLRNLKPNVQKSTSNKKNLKLNFNSIDSNNNSQRFLPKTLVIGSPFYNTSEGSFKSGFNTPTPTATTFHQNLNTTIIEEEDDDDEEDDNNHNGGGIIDNDTFTNDPIVNKLDSSLKTSRAIKLSNLNSNVTLSDVLILIQFGAIENCYFDLIDSNLDYKNVIISFIDCFTANKSFVIISKSISKFKNYLNSPNLKIKKINSLPLSIEIQNEINFNGASRSICFTNLPKNLNLSEIKIFNELSKFGSISTIKYIESKNSSFVNFTSILNAIKCFNQLPISNSIFSNCKLYYSNDLIDNLSNKNSIQFDSTNDSSSNSTNLVFEEINGLFKNNKQEIQFTNSSDSISSRHHSIDYSYNHNSNVDLLQSNFIHPMYIQSPIYEQSFEFSNNSIINNDDINNINNINNLENRCVYLGNLNPTTTNEDICNVIRGGNLESIKLIHGKNIAFITFLNHNDAASLISRSMIENIFINSRLIKIGWGKNSGNLNPIISMSCFNENSNLIASRNLYIGIDENLESIDDYDLVELNSDEIEKIKNKINLKPEYENELKLKSLNFNYLKFKKVYKCIPNEEILRRDFSAFGEIEQINYFKNSACAFINFTNIINCIKTVEDFNNPNTNHLIHESFDNRYSKFKISYGKDRCGNPPKKKKLKNKRKNEIYKNDNKSIDSELAIKMNSAFDGIGISSPSATRKLNSLNKNNLSNDEIDQVDQVDLEIETEIENDDNLSFSSNTSSSRKNSRNRLNSQYSRKSSYKNYSRSSYSGGSNRNNQLYSTPNTIYGFNNYTLNYSSTSIPQGQSIQPIFHDDYFMQQPIYYTPPPNLQSGVFYPPPPYLNGMVKNPSSSGESRNSRK